MFLRYDSHFCLFISVGVNWILMDLIGVLFSDLSYRAQLVALLTRTKREALLPKQFQDIVAFLGIAERFAFIARKFDAVVPFTQFGDAAAGEFDYDV